MEIDEKLRELEPLRKQFWNISPEVGRFLHDIIKKQKPQHILEIGTSNGYSALWFAKAVLENGTGKIITIEPDIERASLAQKNIEETNTVQIIDIKIGDAKEILTTLKEKFDFLFIDARKSEYLNYLQLIEEHLLPGCIIVADNILHPFPDKVENYIEYVRNSGKYESRLENIGSGIEISIKK